MSEHIHLTGEMMQKAIEQEGIVRAEADGECNLCRHQFSKDVLFNYFKVDFSEKIMDELSDSGPGLGSRYGNVYCLRCYNIIDAFMHECGSF